ncbi:uncharacterized protein PV07_09539 [Cladophialophora immunda]|uniref:Major facilitator superfamily (MFS) profile domain-containing protein n=1 Tax=Cladophialophora immunda TaxID=569365 RepID=A0A0D2C7I7_9EURO|nr:uncharacterized protein PV07_09539 [Cladophialophora immunda]KIW26445.1 hypothetical protein PV07_09539 [Cladophialophora immunda]OQV01114.1 hypothetical protein CLAIMM_06521 [Cladophialophora immunda]
MQNQEHEEPRQDWVAPTERDISFQGLPREHESLLKETLYPDDAFKGTTYWADLPAGERTKWVNDQHSSEARRELRDVWQMFKADPLDPINRYLHNYAVTGVGFFTEGYVLFSVGNVLPLLEVVWPQCWRKHSVCDKTMVQAISYMEILGIICGQILVGITGDWIGRRWGLIQDALIMLTGTILLTSMWGVTLSGWTVMYGISLFWFSVGVGGEYPMTSSTAMEGIHGQASSRNDRLHRGRSVALAFLMQGWGQLGNQLVLILVMLIFNHSLNPGYGKTAAQATFRISFGIAGLCLLYFLYLRVYKLKGVDQSLKASRKKGEVTGYDVTSLKLTMNHYWHRLLATSLCWFCNDFPFYGNQIFRNVFLQIVTSSSSQVGTLWLYNLINIGCELAGYYLAALFMDHKFYGRKRMQAVGFIMSFILFIIAAGLYPVLDVKGPGGKAFEFIYFFSSFWIQFGPNSTTFLVAGEVYPAPIRATAHGFSAAVGKLGALCATIIYNYIGGRTKFWVVSWFGLIGFIVTILFIPDTTGLDLREQERYWYFVREGRSQDYHGIAIHPRHLSWYERVVLKRHHQYNPELDRLARINELRELYEKVEGVKGAETDDEKTLPGTNQGDLDDNVSRYFDMERRSGKKNNV